MLTPLYRSMTQMGMATATESPWWYVDGKTCIAAYKPKGATDLAASKINLANPGTYDVAAGTNPAFDASTGWAFAASSNTYLTTGIVPSAGWTVMIRASNYSGTGMLFGAVKSGTPAPRWNIQGNDGSNKIVYGYGSGAATPSVTYTGGVLGMAGAEAFRNGASDGAIAGLWGTLDIGVFIGGRNNAGSLANPCNAKIQAFVVYSGVLSAAEVAALYTRMAAL